MRFIYPEGKRKALTFSYDDGQTMHNPTAFSVWVNTAAGFVEVKPGETKDIGK